MFHAYFFILLATRAALAAGHLHPAQLRDILAAIATVRFRYRITVNPVSLYCLFAHHSFESAGLIDKLGSN